MGLLRELLKFRDLLRDMGLKPLRSLLRDDEGSVEDMRRA
jgi:hypothetical protein